MGFETKDSGERAAFASGMVRDTQTGKPRYGLIPRGPLKRLAELYSRGAEKYAARNWEKADSADELERFAESAFRHLMQLLDGETDEDHGAAVVFNVFAIMWLRERLEQPALGRTATTAELAAARTQPPMHFGGVSLPDIDVPVMRKTRKTCDGCAAPEGSEHKSWCPDHYLAPER